MNLKTPMAAVQHAGFGLAGASLIPVLRTEQPSQFCAPQKAAKQRPLGDEMWQLCSLIIQAKCETFAATECLPLSLLHEKGEAMRKTLMALAAVAALAVSAAAPAHAQRGVGVGIAAGLLGGAIVGGAIASQNGYYGPGYYGPGYGYYGGGPAYVAGPGYGNCYVQRQRFWDGYGWRVRGVRVCD
jgi:hypothetical protein